MGELVIVLRPALAETFGVNRALVLCQMHYLTTHPPRSAVADADGTIWIPNTYESWVQTFQWMSPSGVRKVFDYLRENDLVQTQQGLHVNWYALTPNGCAVFEQDTSPDIAAIVLGTIEELEVSDAELPAGLRRSVRQTAPSATNLPTADTPLSPKDSSNCPGGTVTLYIKESLEEKEDSLSPYSTFLQAFCDICELNASLPSHRRKVERYAQELWEAGYTPDDLQAVPVYWQNDDYRSGRIYPKQVVEVIEAALRRYGKHHASTTETVKTIEAAETVPLPSHTPLEASFEDDENDPMAYLREMSAAPVEEAYDPQPTVHRRIWGMHKMTPLEQAWEIAKQHLQVQLNAPTYDYMIDPLVVVDFIEGVIRIRCFPQLQMQIAENFARALLRTCRQNPFFAEAHSLLIEGKGIAPLKVTPTLESITPAYARTGISSAAAATVAGVG